MPLAISKDPMVAALQRRTDELQALVHQLEKKLADSLTGRDLITVTLPLDNWGSVIAVLHFALKARHVPPESARQIRETLAVIVDCIETPGHKMHALRESLAETLVDTALIVGAVTKGKKGAANGSNHQG